MSFDKSVSFRKLKKLLPGMLLGVCCSAYGAANTLVPALLDEGMKNYAAKHYKAAADYLGQVVDMDAEHSQARYYLVYSLALSGNSEMALKHAEILARKFPADQQYKALVNQIKSDMAKQATIKSDSGSSNYKVQKEVMLGGYKSLDKNFKEIEKPKEDYTPRDITPPRPLTELEKAVRKIDEDDLAGAEKMLKDILKQEPKNADALHYLGFIEFTKVNYNGAISYFKKSIDADPKHFQSLFFLSNSYRNIEDYKSAEKTLVKAVEVKDDEFALLSLADIKIQLNKLAEAESILEKVIAKNPASEATISLAQIRVNQGKFDEALDMVNTALSKGNAGDANYVKALILMENKMYNEALEELGNALKVSPDNQKYLTARALAKVRTLNFTQGIDDANKVLEMNPYNVPARLVIAEAFISTSAETEAEDQLVEVEKLGENAEAYRLRALLEERRGDKKKAKGYLDKFFQMAGALPGGAYAYAETLELIDDNKSEAIKIYSAIIEKFPKSSYADMAKNAIKALKSDSSEDFDSAEDFSVSTPSFDNFGSKARPGKVKY